MRDLMLHHHVVEVSMESTNVYSTSQTMCATKGLFAEKCSLRMNDFVESVHCE